MKYLEAKNEFCHFRKTRDRVFPDTWSLHPRQ